jgi:hypothetical protein
MICKISCSAGNRYSRRSFRTAAGIGGRHEEVSSGLAVGGFIPHVIEVATCFVGWTIIYHLAFVDDAHFIEELID